VENFQHAKPHISRIGWKRCLFCHPSTANIFDPPQLADLAKAGNHGPVRAGLSLHFAEIGGGESDGRALVHCFCVERFFFQPW